MEKSEIEFQAGEYAINYWNGGDKTYDSLEVHKMLCDAYTAGANMALQSV